MNRYWKRKRKAAHFILGQLVKSTFIQKAEITGGVRTPLYSKSYLSKSVEELQKASNGTFELDILRDAADLLHRDGYIEYSSQNTKNENKSEFKTNKDGEFAFQEEFYLLQIRDDKFKRATSTSSFITPILTLLIGVTTLSRTCAGCDKKNEVTIQTDKPIQVLSPTGQKQSLLSGDSLTVSFPEVRPFKS